VTYTKDLWKQVQQECILDTVRMLKERQAAIDEAGWCHQCSVDGVSGVPCRKHGGSR